MNSVIEEFLSRGKTYEATLSVEEVEHEYEFSHTDNGGEKQNVTFGDGDGKEVFNGTMWVKVVR